MITNNKYTIWVFIGWVILYIIGYNIYGDAKRPQNLEDYYDQQEQYNFR